MRWDDHDRALALGYRQWKRARCPDCGTRDEWFDGDLQAMYAQQGRCRGCQISETENALIPEGEKGVKVALFPDLDRPAGRRIAALTDEAD